MVRALGEGGQARVVEAEWLGPGGATRRVALKVADEGLDLFREARLAGLLRHPHIVDVYEYGAADGFRFCAMELCPGGSFAELPPLPPRAVVAIGLQVAAALDYAHQALGLVHLDLKPGNLLRCGSVVKVGDFGVARVATDVHDGRIRGTPRFMAPEQAAGGPVDQRADIWALARVLQDLAHGQASDAHTFDPDADESRPDVDGWLAPLLSRCLVDEPADRLTTMQEFAAILSSLPVEGPGLGDLFAPEASPSAVQSGEDRFVGRARELDALTGLLAAPGVVCIRGTAGVGKSRLAELASRRFDVRFVVALGAQNDVPGAVAAIAAALGVPIGSESTAEAIARIVHGASSRGPAILVLDDADRVEGLGGLVSAFAPAAQLRLVVTRRSALDVGERVFDLGPLDPADATELVVARAQERGVDVRGDPAAERLAQRLDGIPLAIELAAGRVGVLPLHEVLSRLDLSMMRSNRELGDRQGTLQAALAWSHELLDPLEQRVLAELTIFVSPFLPETAQAVIETERPLLDVLDRLIRSSWLEVSKGRLRMYEPVRRFASAPIPLAVEARYRACYARLGTRASLDALRARAGDAASRRYLAEADDLLHAIELATRAHSDEVAPMLRLGWVVFSRVGFAAFSAAALRAGDDPELSRPTRAASLLVAAAVLQRADVHRAQELVDRAEALGADPVDVLDVRLNISLNTGDPAVLAELERRRRGPDVYRALSALNALALAAQMSDRHHDAIALLTEALAAPERLSLSTWCTFTTNLSISLDAVGRVEEAIAVARAAAELVDPAVDRAAFAAIQTSLGAMLPVEAALDHLVLALEAHAWTGNLRSEGGARVTYAQALAEVGQFDRAAEEANRAVALLEATGTRRFVGAAFEILAVAEAGRGRTDAAFAAAESSVDAWLAVGSPLRALRTARKAAETDLGRADHWRARIAAIESSS